MTNQSEELDERTTTIKASSPGLLRAMDANMNRCMEALRLLEEIARFVLDDAHLTEVCKSLRHDLMSLTRSLTNQSLVMRDTTGDVGCTIQTEQEYHRADLIELIQANARRAQQAFRSMEECFKILAPTEAALAEHFRYRCYALEKALVNTFASSCRLTTAQLYVLIDGGNSTNAFLRLVNRLISAGVDILQLRDKTLSDRQLFERAQCLTSSVRTTKTLAIINDRPDIALAAHAHGVHLGQDELPITQVRSIVGPEFLIGVSTHSLEQARQAIREGANYIGIGPVFTSATKDFVEFPGIDFLRQVALDTNHPAFAIGGIRTENLPQVLATGIKRIAISSAVTSAPDPVAAVHRLKELLTTDTTIKPPGTVG